MIALAESHTADSIVANAMYIFAPISTRHLFVAALAFGAAGRIARALDPVKLPGVLVKATPNPPGSRRMGGVVRDTFELYVRLHPNRDCRFWQYHI